MRKKIGHLILAVTEKRLSNLPIPKHLGYFSFLSVLSFVVMYK